MGYNTEFDGRIELTPPLTAEQVATIQTFSETRHGGDIDRHPGMPAIWCDLTASEDGRSIVWNGNEKSYNIPEWMDYLVKTYLRPWGVTANGVLDAYGESRGDVWHLKVENNKVTRC